MSSSKNGEKRRITKTEKIAELQGKLKLLKQENERLKSEASDGMSKSGHSTGSSSKANSDMGKLKEALYALKRVTVKQEVSLAAMRDKAKQRRAEIHERNSLIKELEEENKAFRKAHASLKSSGGDDVSALRSQLADLELKLAREENDRAEQTKKLKESEAGISSLQALLAKTNGRGLRRTPSSDSHGFGSVMSDSTAGEDIAKLKKQLAKKEEKITNLQYELEQCKDEIHDLKERNQFSNAFPKTPAPGELDFFEDDDDFWGNF
ncbi:unnamed protein product [Pseudo-nitzschia multistriata]|uniref:Uncharacterized protein n=1 Tax=Pseudo-nitzschia multistriata TaxID=183589 RepID=A0A448ZEI1_9STRA|nr:unnamed protein product [Pseudo-nitzschia multistriata]